MLPGSKKIIKNRNDLKIKKAPDLFSAFEFNGYIECECFTRPVLLTGKVHQVLE
jgi:hypothetical protein